MLASARQSSSPSRGDAAGTARKETASSAASSSEREPGFHRYWGGLLRRGLHSGPSGGQNSGSRRCKTGALSAPVQDGEVVAAESPALT